MLEQKTILNKKFETIIKRDIEMLFTVRDYCLSHFYITSRNITKDYFYNKRINDLNGSINRTFSIRISIILLYLESIKLLKIYTKCTNHNIFQKTNNKFEQNINYLLKEIKEVDIN
jgi:hypothetical protein